jgi:hypothetical protein
MKPRLQDVLETIQINVANAIQSGLTAGRISLPPAQVVIGFPTSTELVTILSQHAWMMSIYPLPDGHQTSRYTPQPFPVYNPYVTLTAAISGNVLTFGGSVIEGLNVHTYVGGLLADAFYQTQQGDALTSVASGVGNAINALTLPGVSASSSTNSVSITGSPYTICNIGSSATIMAIETNRISRGVQVSAWCSDPEMRWQVMECVEENIGTTDNPFLYLFDGTPLRTQYSGRSDWNNDKSQSAYSLYEYHLTYNLEYGVLRYLTGAQVESIEQTTQVNTNPAVTLYTAV